MTRAEVAELLGSVFTELPEEAAAGLPVYRGKVRDVVLGGKHILLVASDRISAFDRVLASVPCKGEALTRIAEFWFERTADIVPNHLVAGPRLLRGTARATLARRAEMLPVEVVVRGYLAGSAWRDYAAGRPVSGIRLPEGLARNEKFPVPIVTPSTKEAAGHDRPISGAEIVAGGLVEAGLWREVEKAALALFRRGQEIVSEVGLILVDAKYEFGLVDGKLVVADEMHTPDCARFWHAESYEEKLYAGAEQRELDKEPFRRWLLERGFSGEGTPPAIPDEVLVETSLRYVRAYELITGGFLEPFAPEPESEAEAIARIVRERLLPGA
jgi:phosphoribosylaminoimidazole-succinocarboxamide synthase